MTQTTTDNQVSSISEIRRERERAEMTERIMDVARAMFVQDGYEAVTLRKIALAIEYSPGAIYQYFKDKQALIRAIIQKDQQDLRTQIMESMLIEEPRERLIEMARRYAQWGISHPNHYLLLLAPPSNWAREENNLRQDTPPQLERETIKILYESVKDAMRRGVFKDKYTNASLIAATLWAGIHGVIMLEISMSEYDRALIGDKNISFEARFETLKEVFLEGFVKE